MYQSSNLRHFFVFFLIHIILVESTNAQVDSSVIQHKLFENEAILKIRIEGDLNRLIKKKEKEEYVPGVCQFLWSNGDVTEQSFKFKARGYYRNANCYFPPIMLNYRPDSLKTLDGTYGKIKLVTHCYDSKIYIDYILKEYLIYKLYEIISPFSLKSQLADIEYHDTGKKEKHEHNLGFIIEPISALCARLDLTEIKGKYFSDAEINSLEADRVALFMYMIGNTDWRIKSGHNIKFVKIKDHRINKVRVVPYDFDHSGFINTNYAKPSEWSTAESVRERDYIGKCRLTDEYYDILIEDFLNVEDEIYRTIAEFDHLEQKSRNRLIDYIEDFYKELRKPETFKKKLHISCMEKY